MARPQSSAYPPFYETYVKRVTETDIIPAMQSSVQEIIDFLDKIPPDKAEFRYAEGKWSVKQLLQHMIDTERIFTYRALCFARGEKQSLPGFDENEYAAQADSSGRQLKELKEEMVLVRESALRLFRSFTPEMMNRSGLANNNLVTVHALAYIIIGHVRHHFSILQERYLN